MPQENYVVTSHNESLSVVNDSLTFTSPTTYEIEKWALDLLRLEPHAEYINAWWIHYGSHKVGLLEQSIKPSCTTHYCSIESHYTALALNSNVSFSDFDNVSACIALLVNGVL